MKRFGIYLDIMAAIAAAAATIASWLRFMGIGNNKPEPLAVSVAITALSIIIFICVILKAVWRYQED